MGEIVVPPGRAFRAALVSAGAAPARTQGPRRWGRYSGPNARAAPARAWPEAPMNHRSFPVILLGGLCTLAPRASAQFTVSTSKATYDGREPLIVAEKLVNSSMLPVPYSTRTEDGTNASILYQIRAVDPENRATQSPAFKVERNGTQTLQVRTINVHGAGSGFGGEIGPGRSSTMGGALGFGVPFNLMLAPPATTGVYFELVTDTNQVLALAPGERIALTSPGTFLLTALIDEIEINGYRYSSSSTGRLVAETLFNVEPKTRVAHAGAFVETSSTGAQ